ncbi:hypothetical protein ACFLTH_05480, partial [Bacteroidota bacterium]
MSNYGKIAIVRTGTNLDEDKFAEIGRNSSILGPTQDYNNIVIRFSDSGNSEKLANAFIRDIQDLDTEENNTGKVSEGHNLNDIIKNSSKAAEYKKLSEDVKEVFQNR